MNILIAGFAVVAAGFSIVGCFSDKAGITKGEMANPLSLGSYAMESYTQDSLSVQVYLEFRSENLAHETHLAYVRRSSQDSLLSEVGKFDGKYVISNDRLIFTPIHGETGTKSETDLVVLFTRFESGVLTLKNITDSSFEFQKEGDKTWGRAHKISSPLSENL